MMFGWSEKPTKAEVKHLIGGENPARVVSIGHGHYEVTIPDDPEAEVTYKLPYYRSGDPRQTFPNMEVREGEMRIPLDDIVSAILARVEPVEVAAALWQDNDVKAEFMDALATRYSERGIDDGDRRKFLADVKEAVHDKALDRLAGSMASLEYAIAKNYYLHSRIREINDMLRHYDVRRPARGDETEPQLIQIRDEQHLGEFKIGGTAWNEARDFWRREVGRQFPTPVLEPLLVDEVDSTTPAEGDHSPQTVPFESPLT
jgi:hypothetical protein